MSKEVASIEFAGKTYSLETGKMAKFANGSVMVRCGDTMVLVTVVAEVEANPDMDYMPLQVEYREKASAAGKFPGGFLKRETRPSDHEVLCSRLIDRPIRPMFPKTWRFETQIIANVVSFDNEVDPDTLGAVGASAALMISDIPFNGPVSEVRVGKVEGELIINPSFNQLEHSDIDMTIAGTDTSIVMVEGECHEISEEDFLKTLEFAHENIRQLNNLQRQLASKINMTKREFVDKEIPEEIIKTVKDSVLDELVKYVHTITTKNERSEWRKKLKETSIEKLTQSFAENELYKDIDLSVYAEEVLSKLEKQEMRKMILDEGKRLDGRTTTDIRPISCEIGILPRVHGSSLFTRGETQSLGMVTLGTKKDEQMIDGLLPTYTNRFILHYNFPPYCTGETGRMGTGRREIGHGHLAERALKIMLPPAEEFPYAIRVISEILESNGSSSMATVCSGSLSLFDAGVPMKKAVAGIAMGLIKEGEKIAILSDILGDEDFLGDMDFKVTGTSDGITACQMDIKIEGLPLEIMSRALNQAKQGRLHILSKMNELISEPRAELSPYAPRFTTIQIPTDTIGAVIGTGGETIRNIVKETGAEINIEDDGTVTIAATSGESSDSARKMIESIIKKPEEGETYNGTVMEIREGMGAFIEFIPKKQGLLHISQIAHERTVNIADVLKVGDKIEVKLLEITPEGKFRLSRKALLPRPEGMPEEEDDYRRREPSRGRRPDGNRRDDRHGDDRRGPRRR
ncbi:MAG: polyribonucleotide nucleotidyltransferase [Ignavibacteriae bacterium]|nr:polyribonucleotide nucleotidyltransferase [Ignavibacteriota bacterium]